MSKRARLVAAGVVALALAVGGVAYATIPANNVIDACYSKSGGTLRVIDATVTKCSKSETALAWNVQGVKGDKGDTGDTGPQGPAGPAGTSHAYKTFVAGADAPQGGFATVASLSLPAGKFVANVSAIATVDEDVDNLTVDCDLYQGAIVIGKSGAWVEEIGSGADALEATGSIAMTVAPTFGAAGSLDLKCSSFTGGNHLEWIVITAVKVDDITG